MLTDIEARVYDKLITIHQPHSVLIEAIHPCSPSFRIPRLYPAYGVQHLVFMTSRLRARHPIRTIVDTLAEGTKHIRSRV